MSAVLAWFLTWSCYGTRLHGDVRSSVDDEHNLVGGPTLAADRVRENIMRARMKQQAMLLDHAARLVVEHAIREHADIRRLRLLSLYVGTNHVHSVVQAAKDETPEGIMQRFKMWSTRSLIDADLIAKGRRVWTDHGSTLWLNTHDDVAAKMDYVSRLQTHSDRFTREAKER